LRVTSPGIAAQEPVRSEEPHVAGDGDRGLLRLRNSVFIGFAGTGSFRLPEQVLHLLVTEADDVQVEAVFPERLQLDAQHVFIPTRIEA
jgi:hypothetical protein